MRQNGEEDLLMTNDEILRRDKARIIARAVQKWWNNKKKKAERFVATLKIQAFFRMR
jgi:hypothetical protein